MSTVKFTTKVAETSKNSNEMSARRQAGVTSELIPGAPGGQRTPIYIATMMQQRGETGVHTHFTTLASYFKDLKTPVEILTPYEAPTVLRRLAGLLMRAIIPFSVECAWYVRDLLYTQLLWLRMRAKVSSKKPWIVYAQDPVSSLVAQRIRRQRNQEIVLVVHFNESHADEMVESKLIRRNGWVYRKVQTEERAALVRADRIVYVSEFMQRHLFATVPSLSERPSIVLPNFVATPTPARDGYSGDLVSIGTLEPRKNQRFILDVLAAAKRKGRRYSLTLFGPGKLEQRWRELATELGIADQVTFAGFVPHASSWLHRFRVYVHSATIENLPVSLIEAHACGLPVIAARVGGIPEIVTENVNGYFWDLDDPEAATDTVIGLLENAALYASMRTAALESYASRFSAERIAPMLEQFIAGGTTLSRGSGPEAPVWIGSLPSTPNTPLSLDTQERS